MMLFITFCTSASALQVADGHRELVVGESRQRHGHRAVALELQEGAEAQRHGLQQRVAGAVADAVVDALEVVEVDAHHGETLAGGGGFAARFFQQLQQVLPVRQLGQRIEERQLADAIRGAMALGDVAQHQQQAAAVVGHDARFEAALDALADAFELHLGALVAHAAVVERVRDGARGVAAHQFGRSSARGFMPPAGRDDCPWRPAGRRCGRTCRRPAAGRAGRRAWRAGAPSLSSTSCTSRPPRTRYCTRWPSRFQLMGLARKSVAPAW